jgi:REP-associated tyrosine transposase
MNNLGFRFHYRRHLPHFQPPGATLFVTFRLAGSIPAKTLHELQDEARRLEAVLALIPDSETRTSQAYVADRRLFGEWDNALDAGDSGPHWLNDRRVAAVVCDSLLHRDGVAYDLHAYCVMPNHVHAVFQPLPEADGRERPLFAILHSLKRYTARQANQVLKRQGAFWQHESYDHVVRDDEEWQRIVNYVLNNPVAAGLAQSRADWEWSYSKWGL